MKFHTLCPMCYLFYTFILFSMPHHLAIHLLVNFIVPTSKNISNLIWFYMSPGSPDNGTHLTRDKWSEGHTPVSHNARQPQHQYDGPRIPKTMPLRVNNPAIKQKRHDICPAPCHQYKTRSVKIKANRTQQISVKTQVFGKNWTTTLSKWF